MIYCKVENGIVVDRAVFGDEGMPEDWPNRWTWVADEEAQIGWGHDGQAFAPPPPLEPPAYDYRMLRAAAYPPIGDQLDALWKGGAAAEDMLQRVLAVKARYPKPDS